MAIKIAKKKPKWLTKISEENRRAADKAFQGRCAFIIAYLEFLEELDDINEEFGTSFKIDDVFGITQEEEQKALDIVEGDDDEED